MTGFIERHLHDWLYGKASPCLALWKVVSMTGFMERRLYDRLYGKASP